MKRLLAVVGWAGVVALSGCSGGRVVTIQAVEPAMKEVLQIKRVAVLNLTHKNDPSVGVDFANFIVAEMDQSGAFEVMERGAVAKVMAEKEFSTNTTDTAAVSSIGKLLGVDGVIVGEVLLYDAANALLSKKGAVGANLRLVNVQTAQVIFSRAIIKDYNKLLADTRRESILTTLAQEIARDFVADIAPHYVDREKYMLEGSGETCKTNILGIKLACNGLWDKAQEQFQRILTADPNCAAAHNNLAVCFEKAGKIKEATDEYEQALKLDPEEERIQKNLAQARNTLRAPRMAAKEALERAKHQPTGGGE